MKADDVFHHSFLLLGCEFDELYNCREEGRLVSHWLIIARRSRPVQHSCWLKKTMANGRRR